MKVLIYPVSMEIGGSQINAVDLAARAAASGDDVVMFGPDGDLVPVARGLGLEYVVAPEPPGYPTRRRMDALIELVRERGIEIVHGYEWSPSLDLAFGPHRRLGTPMVTTILSMSVPSVIPRHEPVVVGTRELYDLQRQVRDRVHLIEPPIDTSSNAPGTGGPGARERFGLAPDELALVVVGRLTTDLGKAQGVLTAIEVVGSLASRLPIRLVVVGSGPMADRVATAAEAVNSAHGREVVVVAGQLEDPRPAYDAADVVLGMGSSALRGLAFAKPLVVEGEHGYWRDLDEESLPTFLEQGWWGQGGAGAPDLASALEPLLASAQERLRRGRLGREIVVERYGLEQAAASMAEIYADVLERRPDPRRKRAAMRRLAYDVAKERFAMARHGGRDRVRAAASAFRTSP